MATYSGGMRRRLDLAASLVGRPAVIFLDEPTTGLDPRSRLAMWQVIGDLVGSGVTVLLTTQYLEEADRLADRISLIDGGRVVAEGTAGRAEAAVRRPAAGTGAGRRRRVRGGVPPARRTRDRSRPGAAVHQHGDRRHRGAVRALLDDVDPDRRAVRTFAVHSATLDDVFLALTGHPTTLEKETASVWTP